jgi:hypothetical protein
MPLYKAVNDCIKDGYQPYGSPYIDRNGVEKQAMVKYEDESEQPSPNLTSKSQRPKPKKKEAKNED